LQDDSLNQERTFCAFYWKSDGLAINNAEMDNQNPLQLQICIPYAAVGNKVINY